MRLTAILILFSFLAPETRSQDFTGSYYGNLIGDQSSFLITHQKNSNEIIGVVYLSKDSKLYFKGKSSANTLIGSLFEQNDQPIILVNGVLKIDTLFLSLQSKSDSLLKKKCVMVKSSNKLDNQSKLDFYFDHNPRLFGTWVLVGQEVNGKSTMPKEYYSVIYSPDGWQSLQSSHLREQTKRFNLKNYQSTTRWRTQGNKLILTFEGAARGSVENLRFYEIKSDTLVISNNNNPTNKSKFIKK